MAADFKSHILRRDEKGFAGIPFKRLLLAGIGGGLIYTICRFAFPSLAIPAGVITAFASVVLTAERGGLPLWMRLWLHLRGRLLLRSAGRQSGIAVELARMINLATGLERLESAVVFAPATSTSEVDLSEWITFTHAVDLDSGDGLVFVGSPLEEESA